MSASLIILAAGLGSRFKGSVKQLTPVGKNNELLMEYSVADALSAGFDRVIFIIRSDFKAEFIEHIGRKISQHTDVVYCCQDLSPLPKGIFPADISSRTKPLGTVHAVLSAKDEIDGSFLIINADDYYGTTSFKSIYDYLFSEVRRKKEQCMGGFTLKNTLSSTGAVTRGICTAQNGFLKSVTETYNVYADENEKITGTVNGNLIEITGNETVSMNMWGCSKEIIPSLEKCFEEFLIKSVNDNTYLTAEYSLPLAFDKLIKNDEISVKVIPTNDKWYGMTHREDLPEIRRIFAEFADRGIYPSPLFM